MTSKWLTMVDLAGFRTLTIHELHRKYGPTVRIAPNELSFANSECVKEIYGQQTSFFKAQIYESMSVPPFGIFSLRTKDEHSQRRRLLSHAFAQSTLFETEPLIKIHVAKVIEHVKRGAQKPLDAMYLFRSFAFDIAGDLFIGQSFGALDSQHRPQFMEDMDSLFLIGGLEWTFPTIFSFIKKIPLHSIQFFINARIRVVEVKLYPRILPTMSTCPSCWLTRSSSATTRTRNIFRCMVDNLVERIC
jgi:hypothetical protein